MARTVTVWRLARDPERRIAATDTDFTRVELGFAELSRRGLDGPLGPRVEQVPGVRVASA
jgi:hypothetical protein